VAKLLYTYVNPTSPKDLKEACRVLENGGVIAYPTDVNWAFGCDPLSKSAIEKIRQLKPHHPKEQPFSLLCNSISMVSTIADVDGSSFSILKKIFPGPFTILLKRNRTLARQLKDKRKLVGVRIPDSPLLLDLIQTYGKPIATASIPYSIEDHNRHHTEHLLHFGYEVDELYGHGLDLILDLGQEVPANETTVVDLSEGEWTLVRQGMGIQV
jgi:tRNA threonylcarbamoyl adenosine modification protein (Sua5/YciO/YrdC/YwlC family)